MIDHSPSTDLAVNLLEDEAARISIDGDQVRPDIVSLIKRIRELPIAPSWLTAENAIGTVEIPYIKHGLSGIVNWSGSSDEFYNDVRFRRLFDDLQISLPVRGALLDHWCTCKMADVMVAVPMVAVDVQSMYSKLYDMNVFEYYVEGHIPWFQNPGETTVLQIFGRLPLDSDVAERTQSEWGSSE